MQLHYDVDGEDFSQAGDASSQVKKTLKQLAIPTAVIRKVGIAMYEAEINMVIHANGGFIDVEILPDKIEIMLKDTGPGIADVDLAMQEGYSTATSKVRELGFGAGMGLPNMKRYADGMRVESQLGVGTTVYLTVNL